MIPVRYQPPIHYVKLKSANVIARVLAEGDPDTPDVIPVDHFYVYSGPAAPYPPKPAGTELKQDEWLLALVELAKRRIA